MVSYFKSTMAWESKRSMLWSFCASSLLHSFILMGSGVVLFELFHFEPVIQDVKIELQTNSLTQPLAKSAQADTERVKTISEGFASEQEEAYLQTWCAYIEERGSELYRQALNHNVNLNGSLRLLVAIRANGQLDHIQIRESSGLPGLDQLAVNIVQKTAPFQAFSPDIEGVEVLEIIRTWKFDNGKMVQVGDEG